MTPLRQGRPQSARYLFSRLLPLAGLLAEEEPAALKYALSLLGLMRPVTRLPIVPLDDAARAELARAIAGLADEVSADDALQLRRPRGWQRSGGYACAPLRC